MIAAPSALPTRRVNRVGTFVLAQVAFAAAIAGVAVAQGARSFGGAPPSAPPPVVISRLLVSATPKEFTIARVTVPASIPAEQAVTFTVRALGGAMLISRLRGTLAASADTRNVLLTFGVPARAAAGRAPVAEVSFEAADGQRATVTVEVEVAVVRTLALDLLQQATGTKAGGKITLRYRLTNQGNASDTVGMRYELPYGWSTTERDSARVVVPRGSSVLRQAVVQVPNTASAGSFAIVMHAMNSVGTARAEERMYVEVPPNRSGPTGRAISVNTSLSSTTGSAGGGSALMGLAFSGPIFRDVELSVDATSAPALSEQGRYRLSSLGQFPQPPNIMLARGPGHLRIGGVGASFSELTGQGAGGRGVAFGWESARLSIKTAFAGQGLGFGDATPTADRTESPEIAGVRVSRLISSNLWVTGTLARLDEGKAIMGRKLDVAGLGVTVPSLFGGTLESEAAYRRFADGSGIGLFSEFTRTSARERMQFRAILAPGGTAAYAGSKAALSGYMSHALSTQWQLGGQGFLTQTSGSAGTSASAVGGAITPQYFIRKGLSLGLDAGGSFQSLQSRGVSFGSDEQHLSTTVNVALNPQTGMSVTTTAARVTRGLDFDSLAVGDARLTSGRASLLAQMTRGTERFGTLLLGAQASRDESNSVGLPRQFQLSLRLDRFPLFLPGGSSVYATGIVQNLGWFGDRPSVTTLRGDLTAELPLGIALTFAADRNPLVSVAGAGPWSTSLRVSRTSFLTMPAFLRFGSRGGLVFEDLDGNGVQDPGEPGMGGVIIRRGDQSATTEEDGSFKFTNSAGVHTERLRIDPRSLPAGWMEKGTPLSEEEARRVRAIGVVPTSAVRMHLIMRREDLGATGSIDLTQVVVVARDSLQRTYLAQPTDSITQSFSALPPGSYRMSVDASAAGAAIQITQMPTNFRVGSERKGHDYDVVFSTRSVKLKNFGPRADDKAPAPSTKQSSPAVLPRRSTSARADTVIVDPRVRSPRPPQ